MVANQILQDIMTNHAVGKQSFKGMGKELDRKTDGFMRYFRAQ